MNRNNERLNAKNNRKRTFRGISFTKTNRVLTKATCQFIRRKDMTHDLKHSTNITRSLYFNESPIPALSDTTRSESLPCNTYVGVDVFCFYTYRFFFNTTAPKLVTRYSGHSSMGTHSRHTLSLNLVPHT